MRFISTLSFLLVFWTLPVLTFAQPITGKWKGYFTPNNNSGFNVFTYDVQLVQSTGENITVTTLSKLNNQFAAKAYGTGTISGKMVQFQENRFDVIKLGSSSQGCLMTCYLNYTNIRGLDVLEGTYTSISTHGSKDCGGGTVYLQKDQPIEKTIADISPKAEKNKKNPAHPTVIDPQKLTSQKSTLQKENDNSNILKNNTTNKINHTKAIANNSIKKESPQTQIATSTNNSAQQITTKNSLSTNTTTEKLNQEPNLASSTQKNSNNNNSEMTAGSSSEDNTIDNIPWVLVGRENKLVKQISTNSKQFSIDLYDNGTIDNDTINVYDNKKLLANLKRLSDKPIHLEFNFTEKTKQHEVIITAHNMGLVPPNTALLVLKENGNRQELFITTTNTFNAKIIIQYAPPN